MDTIPFHWDTLAAPQCLVMACLCPDECHEGWLCRKLLCFTYLLATGSAAYHFSQRRSRHRRRNIHLRRLKFKHFHSVCLIRVLGVKVSFWREDQSDPSSGEWCIISMKKSLIWTFAYYSCKAYDSRRQLSPETLAEILEAGRMAPTAKNLQEQHIYVCQSPEALAKIGACTPCRYGAPHN